MLRRLFATGYICKCHIRTRPRLFIFNVLLRYLSKRILDSFHTKFLRLKKSKSRGRGLHDALVFCLARKESSEKGARPPCPAKHTAGSLHAINVVWGSKKLAFALHLCRPGSQNIYSAPLVSPRKRGRFTPVIYYPPPPPHKYDPEYRGSR